MKKKLISLALTAVMVMSLGVSASAGAAGTTGVTNLSLDGMDWHGLMSRPVTQHYEPTPAECKTPTGLLSENADGLARSNADANTAADTTEADTTEVTNLSLEGMDFHALMSRPVTQHYESTPAECPTPTGLLYENADGLARSNVGANTQVIKGQPLIPEDTSAGAYYYAAADFSTAYTEAFVNITLPTSLNTLGGKRAAFICLGVQGYKGQAGVDIGLKNVGSGWFPSYGDVHVKEYYDYPENTISSLATNVQMGIKPLSTTQIRVYMQGFNSSGVAVGNEFYKDITVADGNFDMVGSVVRCRFYRFASLIPNGGRTSGVSDGSYMRGAQMLYPQLYTTGNQYVTWAVPSSNVTNCWVVYPSKCSLAYSQYADSFNINHI